MRLSLLALFFLILINGCGSKSTPPTTSDAKSSAAAQDSPAIASEDGADATAATESSAPTPNQEKAEIDNSDGKRGICWCG